MNEVTAAIARVEVADIDEALPLYVTLSGGARPRRFTVPGIELAWIGSFLLLCGTPQRLAEARRVATLLVDNIDEIAETIRRAGGTILESPAPAPNGRRMIAHHPDGSVFEYIEAAPESRSK